MYEARTRQSGEAGLTLPEVFGWTPETPRQAWLAVRGDPNLPGTHFGPSSLRQFMPRLALNTWRGAVHLTRRTVIVNLYNHTPTPIARGWSVQITQVRDFRGRGLTYDSHNGTDFAVPPGTLIVAAAPGIVVARRSEYNRGGLKLYIDHGGGLLTTSNHLARTLVQVGERVARGQAVALSGYSGLDGLVAFPWVAPHLHYNVSLGGVLTDPFAPLPHEHGDASIWRAPTPTPTPWQPQTGAPQGDAAFAPTTFDPARVAALLADLRDPTRRAQFAAIADLSQRAWQLVIESFTYPTRFSSHTAGMALFDEVRRRACLDLPFAAAQWDGAVFADDVALRDAPMRG